MPCPMAVCEGLVGVVVGEGVKGMFWVVAGESAVSDDDDVENDAFLNDVLNDGSGRVASTPCSLPSPYSKKLAWCRSGEYFSTAS